MSEVIAEAARVLADQFDEWLFRMHGITSSCDHTTEGRAMAEALAEARLLAPDYREEWKP